MSVDELERIDRLGSAAAADLQRDLAAGLDPDDMLRRMHRSRVRRTHALGATAAAAVLVVGSAVGLVAGNGSSATPLPPADTPAPGVERGCAEGATCPGGARLRLDLPRLVEVDMPPGFTLGAHSADLLREDVHAGASLLLDVVPVAYAADWRRAPGAGRTARSMAHWLAARPFLRDAHVEQQTLQGVTAWTVTGELRPGAKEPARRTEGTPLAPALRSAYVKAGWSRLIASQFTLVDQSGGGVSAIWSWAWGEPDSVLPGNQPAVDALVAALGNS